MNKVKGTINNPWTCEDPNQPVKRGEFYLLTQSYARNWYIAVKNGMIKDEGSFYLGDAGRKTFHFVGKDKKFALEEAERILNRTSSFQVEPDPREQFKSTLEAICETLHLESTASQKEIIHKINEIMAVNSLIKNAIDEMS